MPQKLKVLNKIIIQTKSGKLEFAITQITIPKIGEWQYH